MYGLFWNRDRLKDALILLGVILAFLFLTVLVYPKFAFIGTDGVSYSLLAKSIAEGNGLTIFGKPSIYFSPFSSVGIVPFYWLIGDIDVAAHAALILFGVLSLIIFYCTLRSFLDRTTAGIATLFLAVNSTFVLRSMGVTAQPMAGLLSVSLFYFLVKFGSADKNHKKIILHSALLGIIAGALYLTRPEYFFLFIPVSLFVFFVNRNEVSLRKNLGLVLLPLLTFLLLATPLIIFLHAHTDQWTFIPTNRLTDSFLDSVKVGVGPMSEAPPAWSENPLILIIKKVVSLSFAKDYLENLLHMEKILLGAFGIFGFALFGVGLRQMIIQKRYKVLGAILVSASPLLVLAMGHTGENGYIMPSLYLFVLFIGIGCCSLASEVASSLGLSQWKNRALLTALTALGVLYFSFTLFQNLIFMPIQNAKPVEYQILGAWFKDNAQNYQGESLLARKPEIAFYAGARWVEISEKQSPEALLDIMKKDGAQFLAVDTRSMGEYVPHFTGEKGQYVLPNTLELVKEVDYYDQKIYLYRLTKKL